jgi:hypothetical protein
MNGNMCKDCIQQRINELEGKFPKYQLLIFSQNLQFENPIQQFLFAETTSVLCTNEESPFVYD